MAKGGFMRKKKLAAVKPGIRLMQGKHPTGYCPATSCHCELLQKSIVLEMIHSSIHSVSVHGLQSLYCTPIYLALG